MTQETKVLFVRIPKEMSDKLSEIAKDEMRTQVSVARQAIKEFLERKALSQIVSQP